MTVISTRWESDIHTNRITRDELFKWLWGCIYRLSEGIYSALEVSIKLVCDLYVRWRFGIRCGCSYGGGVHRSLIYSCNFTVFRQHWKALCDSPKLFLVSVYLCFSTGVLLIAPFFKSYVL